LQYPIFSRKTPDRLLLQGKKAEGKEEGSGVREKEDLRK